MGGHRLYGFEGPKKENGNIVNRERINVQEVPEEVERWFDWYNRLLAGETQASIIKENNAREVPTPGGSIGKWQVGNFKHMMVKEAYVIFDPTGHPEDCPCLENRPDGGTLVHPSSGTKHRAQHRGFITPEDHEVLVVTVDRNGQKWPHGPVKGRAYMFSGILRCGGVYNGKPCLAPMYGNGRDLADGSYQRRYRCKPYNNNLERVACGNVYRDAVAIDAWVIGQVIQRLTTEEVTSALIPEEDNARAVELTKKLTALRKRADLIQRQYARGEIEELSEYKVMKAEVETAIEEQQTELRKLQTTKVGRMLPADGKIAEAFDSATLQWKRDIIDMVVERIIVHPGHPGSKTWNGKRFNSELIEIVWRELSSLSGVITVLRAALGR